jgi:transketolase
VHGTPSDWFASYGWRISGTEHGSEWAPVTRALLEAAPGGEGSGTPSMVWFKTRKGRGYLKYDNKSHGAAHPMNSEPFWTLRKQFMEKYGVVYEGVGEPAPDGKEAQRAQAEHNFSVAMSILESRPEVVDYVSDRLVELAKAVPDEIPTFNLNDAGKGVFDDPRLYDFENYPAEIYAKPGQSKPNRAALAAWGSWVNSFAREEYGRPVFVVCSADLADSTNISGFAKGHGDTEGWGWYQRDDNLRGTLLPQQITEFTNAGVCVGAASVNLAADPMKEFNGFWTGCSTYGSFSYLKYGPMRLFSQLAQDCDLKVGKVLWVAGHSGPETAEDSRTHFGIFAPGVTQLFPEGHVIDLHPWEYNEVPVVLAAAFRQQAPIVALHLTRPSVPIPDREALGMDSHFAAARGAYVLRPFREDKPKQGTVFVQGTSTTNNLVQVLPELDSAGLNVKVVAAISPQLFALQDAAYRERVVSTADRWDSMMISNRSRRVSRDWIPHHIAADYSLTSDFDDRWRTGGSVEEVIAESHLSPRHIVEGIERFVSDREKRLTALRSALEACESR